MRKSPVPVRRYSRIPRIAPLSIYTVIRLKNCPVIFLTARVHPSETSSSYFIEGLVSFLKGESRAAAVLRELFIFQIIPMLNPDGVEHGNFRFDH
jgi:murein tripeptide amidase MpaA